MLILCTQSILKVLTIVIINFLLDLTRKKMLGLAFTGCNTKNSLMTIKFKTKNPEGQASRMHIVLVAQQIIEIGDSGITIVD